MTQESFKGNIPVKHNGAWKTPTTIYAKHRNKWKEVSEIWLNNNGEWTKFTLDILDESISSWEDFAVAMAQKLNISFPAVLTAAAVDNTIQLTGINGKAFSVKCVIKNNALMPEWITESSNADYKVIDRSINKIATAFGKISSVQNSVTGQPAVKATTAINIPINTFIPILRSNGMLEYQSISRFDIDGYDYISYPNSHVAVIGDELSPITEFIMPSSAATRYELLQTLANTINSQQNVNHNYSATVENEQLVVTAETPGSAANGKKIIIRVITWQTKYNENTQVYDSTYLGGSNGIIIKNGTFAGGIDADVYDYLPQITNIAFEGIFERNLQIIISINNREISL